MLPIRSTHQLFSKKNQNLLSPITGQSTHPAIQVNQYSWPSGKTSYSDNSRIVALSASSIEVSETPAFEDYQFSATRA
jgi:hypothetical protein